MSASEPKQLTPKQTPTAALSQERVKKALDDVVRTIRLSIAEKNQAVWDELIAALGKKCCRYGGLKELHDSLWNPDGTPKVKEQQVAG